MTGELQCPRCAFHMSPVAVPPSCPTCGVPLSYVPDGPFELPGTGRESPGVWRYASLLPRVEPVTLGEGGTPLVPSVRVGAGLGIGLAFKVEGANPTGSFKDRGAAVLVSVLRTFGATTMADDSSGNAGAALAAYAARAGLRSVLFVPAHASGAKLAQIEALGAEVVRVPGDRKQSTLAALDACHTDPGLMYASHNGSPYFIVGQTTLAYELLEDSAERAPDHVVVPVGGGGLFLGVVYGFLRLRDLGRIERVPRVHVAQPAACAPIIHGYRGGEPLEAEPQPTVAEGARIPDPVRGREVVAMLKAVGGVAVGVGEEAILSAQRSLALTEGLYVEPTAALPVAALPEIIARGSIQQGETVVVILTGSGLKAART